MSKFSPQLKSLIEGHEARRKFPYRCSSDKLSIGVGRNLDDRGLTDEEIDFLFENDIEIAVSDCERLFTNWDSHNQARQYAMIDFLFNLGFSRAKGFTKMISAFNRGEYTHAAEELLDSRYARQVGERARTLASMIRNGVL